MSLERIHILRNRLDRKLNIFLLFVPIIIFILVLSLFVSAYKSGRIASELAPTVLGGAASELDNQSDFLGK